MAWDKTTFTAHSSPPISALWLNGIQDHIIEEDAKRISTDAQSFTPTQQAQARTNIGAVSASEMESAIDAAGTVKVTVTRSANSSQQSYTSSDDANIAKLTSDHIVGPHDYILSNEGAMSADWSVNTDDAPTKITVTGTCSAATQLTLFFRLLQQ